MIYINGRFLTQNITGVQRFAYELSLRLTIIRRDVIILVPKISLIKKDYDISQLKILETNFGDGYYWEQVTLPLFLRKRKNSLLINLCNLGPVAYKNKIITQHDISYIRFPSSFTFRFKLLYRILTPLLLLGSKSIITVSDFSRNEISNFYKFDKEKIHVIPNAVSDIFYNFKKIKITSDKYFLTVSSVSYHKNIHGLINAILKSDLDINLKVVGDRSNVFNGLEINTNDTRISFLGRISDQELVELYSGSIAFIFPSLYEGFGIPPLEAQSCSCPVISSDRAAMKEVLGDSALFFDPESNLDIIKNILLVQNDPDVRSDLISKGKKNVQRFSWKDSAFKLNLIINNLKASKG
ncbi:glycosyltransferase family 4 protein [Raoultella terrigena]|uniref:glycosyltransferase family 4 protein n=1 Tax=Raoultella terrigena TaxID=577 RepID=UPI001F520C38|nr:glycosyltransferase family 1 protein [Raoultella terrigena]MCI1030800.1 glycosyltransferase family 4 protein [Raoultella terrigena]